MRFRKEAHETDNKLGFARYSHRFPLNFSLISAMAARQFNDLKYGSELEAARAYEQFKAMFPKPPTSEEDVDKQQRALLDQQAQEIGKLRQGSSEPEFKVTC